MRYSSLLRCKKMSFQSQSKAASTPSRVPERVWKRVPFHQTRNGESQTTKCVATTLWNHQLLTVGWCKALTAWNVRSTHAAVHLVLRSLLQTPMNCDSEFILDRLRNARYANVCSGKSFSRDWQTDSFAVTSPFSHPANSSSSIQSTHDPTGLKSL